MGRPFSSRGLAGLAPAPKPAVILPDTANPASATTEADTANEAALQYYHAASLMRGDETLHIDLSDQSHLADIPPQIAQCRYLTTLNLAGTNVRDLEALASLPRLERLVLWGTAVRDLGPLRHIRSLRWINIGCTEVTDLEPLAALPHLEVVDLSHTPVEDIEPLGSCLRLRELIMRGSQIARIDAVARMRDLRLLDIAGTKVTDTSAARSLKGLDWLNEGAI